MALPAPPPDLDLNESRVPLVLGTNIATCLLAVIAIGLRFSARKLTRQPLWWDDWLIVVAMVFAFLMMFTSIIWMVNNGLGRHVWVGPPDGNVVWAKGLFISEISYTLIICSIKSSILCFYWRIFKQSRIRLPIYIIGAVIACWGVAVILVTVFQCIPVNLFWDRFQPGNNPTLARCPVNVNNFFIGNSVPNIVTDAAIVLLPLPFIWKLNLRKSQKIALSNVFILGIFIVGVSIARFVIIVNLDLQSPDLNWNFVPTQVMTAVESHIGIVCACLPSLQPILNLMLHGTVDRRPQDRTPGKVSGGYTWGSRKPHSKKQSNSGSGTHPFARMPENQSDPHELEYGVGRGKIGVRTDITVNSIPA